MLIRQSERQLTVGAGANHWGGPVGAAPAALVAVLRKFWLDVLPILRMGTSCMADMSEQSPPLVAATPLSSAVLKAPHDALQLQGFPVLPCALASNFCVITASIDEAQHLMVQHDCQGIVH